MRGRLAGEGARAGVGGEVRRGEERWERLKTARLGKEKKTERARVGSSQALSQRGGPKTGTPPRGRIRNAKKNGRPRPAERSDSSSPPSLARAIESEPDSYLLPRPPPAAAAAPRPPERAAAAPALDLARLPTRPEPPGRGEEGGRRRRRLLPTSLKGAGRARRARLLPGPRFFELAFVVGAASFFARARA